MNSPPQTDPALSVDEALATRRSIRAFLPKPVAQADIEAILEASSRAPSGTNTQPWRVRVLSEAALARLVAAVTAAHNDPSHVQAEEYAYYPSEWKSPFIDRRRKVGWDLYGLLGIGKADKARMQAQHGRNYGFFDAPVGLIFTIDRILNQGSWLDYGMFLQSIMLAARARGLHTCPQAAWTPFHRVVAQTLQFAPEEMLVCGMALGYADPDAIENSLRTERDPVSQFTSFHRT
jgi:nitroreductase